MRFQAVLANDDQDGIAMLLNTDGCTLGLSDAGAHVGQLCDAVLRHRPARQLGARQGRARRSSRRSTSSRRCRPTCSASPIGACCAEVPYADVVVFDPATIAPGPMRRVRDFPADAERLTADQPTGMHQVLVNGRTVVEDGKLDEQAVADRPGVWVAPARRV